MTQALLQASLAGAVMILAAAILRIRFGRETPRRVFCLLWDLVLLRLLVPVSIPSPLSIGRLLTLRQTAPLQNAVFQSGDRVETTFVETFAVQPVSGAWPAASAQGPNWLTLLWCAGAVVCAVWLLWGHLQSRSLYAMSLPVEDAFIRRWQEAHPLRRFVQVRRSDRIAAPLTYGVLQPVVLLPSRMQLSDREDLSYILEHEYTHIRRCDTLRKYLLAVGLCLHWFNPFVWLLYSLANRDMELACDEAVVRSGADRQGYALALLRMEEERGSSILSGSHFSAHALEERIEAIMKHKHLSLTALLAVLVVMAVTTTVFATSAPKDPQDAAPVSGLAGSHDISLVMKDVLTESQGPDGVPRYSADGGETWMNEEQYHAQYGSDWGDGWQVEWWTYDGYKAWLEQEKLALQSVIGSRGYTGSEGWFVWDQKRVDETIALYEEVLENIKNGALYSKSITDQNGNPVEDAAVLASGGERTGSSFEVETKTSMASMLDTAALLKIYQPFGITGSWEDGLYYNGQRIQHLVDGYAVEDIGYGVRYAYTDEGGTIDIHTLYEAVPLPGGGVDPSGKLVGFVQRGEDGFDPDLLSVLLTTSGTPQTTQVTAEAQGHSAGQGRTLADIFSDYAAFGIRYEESAENEWRLTYNGEPVLSFADLKPDGSAFSYSNPYASTGRTVLTDYQNGQLIGLTVE